MLISISLSLTIHSFSLRLFIIYFSFPILVSLPPPSPPIQPSYSSFWRPRTNTSGSTVSPGKPLPHFCVLYLLHIHIHFNILISYPFHMTTDSGLFQNAYSPTPTTETTKPTKPKQNSVSICTSDDTITSARVGFEIPCLEMALVSL